MVYNFCEVGRKVEGKGQRWEAQKERDGHGRCHFGEWKRLHWGNKEFLGNTEGPVVLRNLELYNSDLPILWDFFLKSTAEFEKHWLVSVMFNLAMHQNYLGSFYQCFLMFIY